MSDFSTDVKDTVPGIDFDPDTLRAKYREERDKRIRADGNEQYVEVKGDFTRYVDDPYVDPGFTREPLDETVEVLIIGGGFGGLLAGARLRQAGLKDIRIVEKGGDFGGTGTGTVIPARSATSRHHDNARRNANSQRDCDAGGQDQSRMGLSAGRLRKSRSDLRRVQETPIEALRSRMFDLPRIDSVGYGMTNGGPNRARRQSIERSI